MTASVIIVNLKWTLFDRVDFDVKEPTTRSTVKRQDGPDMILMYNAEHGIYFFLIFFTFNWMR